MPLCRPGFQQLALSSPVDDDDDEENDDDDDEAEPDWVSASTGRSASSSENHSGGVKKSRAGAMVDEMAGLKVGGAERYEDSSPLGSKRGRAPPLGMIERQDSFDVTPTMTFEMDGLRIKPEGMLMEEPAFPAGGQNIFGGGAALASSGPPLVRRLKTDILYTDLENVKLLGRGATSRVFLAKHKPTGHLYAVKELNAMADDDTRHMACNELRIAHKHAAHAEHLVHFVDAYFSNDKICIAMEFADAGSYEDVIQRSHGGVPYPPLGAITLQVLLGLQYLHREMKQVHRDLKPANVMLTRAGVAKLSDFGISKQLESTGAVAITQVGTSAYMAPERLKGERYGWTSDVWSVGVMTLEAITTAHPFESARSFLALNAAICLSPAPLPPEATPAEIADFVALCLIKEADAGARGGGDGSIPADGGALPAVRPSVNALVRCAWLRQCGRSEPQQIVASYLQETMG